MRRHSSRGVTVALAFVYLLSWAPGCAIWNRPPGTSGFLGDYSLLVEGRSNQARLVYLHSAADFSAYDAIIVDPIVVWDAKTARRDLDPPEEIQQQADYFGQALRAQLQHVYRLVDDAQERTLRLRLAIVEGLGRGVHIEAELTDSMSGERLIAAVDQLELSTPAGSAAAVADTNQIYHRWAEIIRNRLAALRDFDASLNEESEAG